MDTIHDDLKQALAGIDDFILKSTGLRASQEQIAKALTRYFVLNEILEFIKMDREGDDPTPRNG